MAISFRHSPRKPERLARAAASALVLMFCFGAAGIAAADPRHHHGLVGGDTFNALVGAGPDAARPWTGAWRFRMFRGGGCSRSYPMHEGFPCGSSTGGPVGGMGS